MKKFWLYTALSLLLLALLLSLVGCKGDKGDDGVMDPAGITPLLQINATTGYWEVSYDNGTTWTSMGVKAQGDTGATGAAGAAGVTPKLRINSDTGYWEVSYNDGATWLSLDIKAQGDKGDTGATGIGPKFRINTLTGYWEISYDNGATYTSMGVKAQGEQGVQGQTGAPGATGSEGPAGITPRLRINSATGYWEVSYDNGTTWASLEVKAQGDAGTRISIGENGNWFLDGVDSGYKATDNITKEFVPVLRFAVTSDLHLRSLQKESNDYKSHEMLQSLYRTAYAYSDSQPYSALDAIFFAGDFTQNGYDAEMQEFFAMVKEYTREGTVSRAVLGNHEFYNTRVDDGTTKDDRYSQTSIANTRANYQKYGEYEDIDAHLIIGGYHFLVLNMDRYNKDHTGSKFSPERLAWLETELQIAAADDPTGKRPIFVFQHMPATGTVNDTAQSASDDYLEAIFSKYPQVVDFSGHTHRSILEPQSIWQGGYTAINTGSLAYLSLTIRGHATYDNSGVRDIDGQGTWDVGDLEKEIRNAGLYYFVEVNADNEIRLVIYNIFADTVQAIIYVGPVGDTSKFTHTAHREYTSEAPYFNADAALSLSVNTSSYASLVIPQAGCEQGVNNYRVELYQGSTLISTTYRLSCQHLGFAMPKTIMAPLTGLSPNTTYKVKVFPISEWGKQGGALYFSFTTPAASGTEHTPDLLETVFNADGTATNAVTGRLLDQTGTPTVTYNSELARNVAAFDGTNCYILNGMTALYPVMERGYTIECYFRVDSFTATGTYYDIFSNQQSGGFGFELKTNGELRFYCNTSGGGNTPAQKISAGEWVHAVGVYDGTSAKLYINGVLVSEASRTGTVKLPAADSRFLCIGADSDPSGAGNCNMVGEIATANLYVGALSATEILARYAKY